MDRITSSWRVKDVVRAVVGRSFRNANRAALTGRPIRLRANGGRATKTAAASGP